VAGGRNQAEAELIRNLLIEEGVPSLLRRSAGFDVPDFLAAGERDVLVPRSGAEHARATLRGADLTEETPSAATPPAPRAPTLGRAAALGGIVLGAGALAAGVAYLGLWLGA
jgi:hypothetical protein